MSIICTPLPGFYSDGITIKQVGENGIIIATILPETCTPVGPTLYKYDTMYSYDLCTACCTGMAQTIYTNGATFSASTIAYNTHTGLSKAATGYYSFNGSTYIYVGANGVITEVAPCTCNCVVPIICEKWSIVNTGNSSLNYSYPDCDGIFRYGTVYVGGYHVTTCVQKSYITAYGSYYLTLVAPC